MEDMLPETETLWVSETPRATKASRAPEVSGALGNLLRDHKGIDVLVLDLRKMETWTDFFVIATATSDAHLDGLERHVKEFCRESEIEILRRSRRPNMSHEMRGQQDEWRIIDLGGIVIHLMSQKTREFYELERLYSDASTSSTPD